MHCISKENFEQKASGIGLFYTNRIPNKLWTYFFTSV